MRIIILMALGLSYHSANADVFKCTDMAGKTIYQSKPCQEAAKGQQLDIKVDPAKEAEAQAKYDALQMEYDAKKNAELESERTAAEQRVKVEQVESLRQSAVAQQQQAIAQQRQADAMERQNQQVNSPLMIIQTPQIAPGAPSHRMSPPPSAVATPRPSLE